MNAQAAAFLALGLVLYAWVGKANVPPAVANAVAWVLALIGTLLLLASAAGWSLPS